MRILSFAATAALFVPCCFAQTTATNASTACQTLAKCRTELKAARELVSVSAETIASLTEERDKLAATNKELAVKADAALLMMKIIDKEMRYAPLSDDEKKLLSTVRADEVLNAGIAIEKDQNVYAQTIQKLMEDNDAVVRRYNALLADYKDYVTRVGIQLAAIGQANRVSNALALYNAMPKYSPPQQVNVQVTDCSKTPALCVH
jgi:hypothetical protein